MSSSIGNLTKLQELYWQDNAFTGILPTEMAPHEEMQYAQLWHAIVSFVLMAIILAHIYIGSVGMQGAYSAMGSGEVDEAWAHQHHSIWLDEVKAKQGGASRPAEPAE